MKPTIQELGKAIETLTQYNLWRRDDNVPNSQEMPNPKDIGLAIEVSLKALKFARAMMKPSAHMIAHAYLTHEKASENNVYAHQWPMIQALKTATEQAWEEAAVPKEVEGE